MLVEELKLKEDPLFDFLEEVDIARDVEIYYYDDKSSKVLGGFHSPSKNVIYINLDGRCNNTYIQRANNLIMLFPTVMHELFHYFQRKSMGRIIYGVLQIPLIRKYTIEPNAYKISEYLYDKIKKYQEMSMKDFAKLKKKYNFPKHEFDEMEIKFLNEDKE
jgi:hypothetical protein